MSYQNIFSTAIVSAKYNFLGQILFRIISFILNVIIVRSVSKEVLGIVNVRLMLLYSTSIFLGTEGFRRACLTQDKTFEQQSIINTLWLCVPLTFIISGILSFIWIVFLTKPDPSILYYDKAVILYAISTILESVSQLFYILSQIYHFVKLKTYIESIALIVKNLSLLVLLKNVPHFGLLNFASCQILYSSLLTLMYVIYFVWKIKSIPKLNGFFKDTRELLPKNYSFRYTKEANDASPLPLVWSFTYQSFMKQFLTEGERYIMTFFNVLNFAQQGVYDLVNNLASLIARVVYLPLEDSAYFYFTQTMTRHEKPEDTKSTTADKEADKKGSPPKMLLNLLSLVIIIGTLAITFGPPYAQTALRLYMGDSASNFTASNIKILSEATSLLQIYCFYLFLLGVNGISEAFAFATFTKIQIDRYNRILVCFSLAFLALATPLASMWGPVGLLLANCFNVTLRISYAIGYILSRCYGQRAPLASGAIAFGRHIVPSWATCVWLIVTAVVTHLSNNLIFVSPTIYQYFLHLSIGLIMGFLSLCVIYRNEKELSTFLKDCYSRPKID